MIISKNTCILTFINLLTHFCLLDKKRLMKIASNKQMEYIDWKTNSVPNAVDMINFWESINL